MKKWKGMKMITEKKLLDNYDGVTNGASYISTFDGMCIIWDYRRGNNGDGYNPTREKREEASEIYIYNSGEMIPLEDGCERHPILEKMYADCERALYSWKRQ